MKIRHFIFCFILCLFTISEGYSQERQRRKGDEAYRNNQYQTAITHYQKALSRLDAGTASDRMTHRLAEIHNLIHDYETSAKYYEEVALTRFAERIDIIWLEYANVLRKISRCDEAETFYHKYLANNPDSQLALNGLKSCEFVRNYGDAQGIYSIQNESHLNSSADDFAVTYISDNGREIVFTSNRRQATGDLTDNWTGHKFSDLFISSAGTTGRWSNPSLVDRTGIINTEDHEGVPFYASASETLYFTRCPRVVERRQFCDIWAVKRDRNRWVEPVRVISERVSNAGHPTLSQDELTIIFSSSNREGYGGKDLWMAQRESTEQPFDDPVNLGPVINTEGDEKFPYLKNDTVLYFASDGHPGFGGLDIFYSIFKNGSFSKPVNLLPPINSHGDDFGIVFHPDGDKGFISSNRNGGLGGDDIYSFSERSLIFDVEGQVADNNTLLNIPFPVLYLIDSAGDSLVIQGNRTGGYSKRGLTVMDENDYTIVATKQDYLSKSASFSTANISVDTVFVIDFLLDPIPVEAIILPEIQYEFDRWDIQPQFRDSLMVLYEILTYNPNLVIELASHTDSRGTHEYNDELSQKRALAVIDFLIQRGIESDRLQARGHGKRVPRVLEKDFIYNSMIFQKGTRLTDDYINRLPSERHREFAYQLNRRTEFRVISRNYIPRTKAIADIPVIVSENTEVISFYHQDDSKIIIDIILNEFATPAIIDVQSENSSLDVELVLSLLGEGFVSRHNFIEPESFWIIDGVIQKGATLNANTLRLGRISLNNVYFTTDELSDPPVILGNDFLNLFERHYIDYENNTITFEY